jgi:heme/copper-type cytochrome/quinol oxidase subunit 2
MRHALVLLAAALAGCGRPAALAAAGPQAGRIAGLWALTFWIAAAVEVVVVAILLYAVARAHRPTHDAAVVVPEPRLERQLQRTIGVAIVLTALVVLGLLVASALTARALGTLG